MTRQHKYALNATFTARIAGQQALLAQIAKLILSLWVRVVFALISVASLILKMAT